MIKLISKITNFSICFLNRNRLYLNHRDFKYVNTKFIDHFNTVWSLQPVLIEFCNFCIGEIASSKAK